MRLTTFAAAALAIGCSIAPANTTAPPPAGAKTMTATHVSLDQYEAQVRRFSPTRGLAATNSNDVRRFVYDWFTHFEHASKAEFFLEHLDDANMSLTFPGMSPLTSHAQYRDWYDNLLAQTLWNFHDLSDIRVEQAGPEHYRVSMLIDWYGEVKPGSPQLAGWQSRSDSHLYHHRVQQTWEVSVKEGVVIEKLIASPAPER